MSAFEPFEDFDADADAMGRFRQLLLSDPAENLSQRFKFFAQQNPALAVQHLGFVPKIIKQGYACAYVPEDAMVFSIGFWYTYRYPELMLLPAAPSATPERMELVLSSIAEKLASGPPVDASGWQRNPQAFLQARAREIGALFSEALSRQQLRAEALVNASEDFLNEHPYGFGWYFYRHFADDFRAPLLCAHVS